MLPLIKRATRALPDEARPRRDPGRVLPRRDGGQALRPGDFEVGCEVLVPRIHRNGNTFTTWCTVLEVRGGGLLVDVPLEEPQPVSMVQLQRVAEIEAEVFLDSDDLMDLRDLLEHVETSDVLLLFQTKSVLQRPWCLLELYTAIREGVPIVPLQIAGLTNYEYEFAAAQTLLENLEVELEKVNPGAGARIVEYGVPLAELQKTLLDAIPM